MNTTNMGVFINPFTDWGFKHIFISRKPFIAKERKVNTGTSDQTLSMAYTLPISIWTGRITESFDGIQSWQIRKPTQYEEEWKNWNDYYNTLDYAKKEGVEAGYAEGLQIGMEKGMAEGMEKGIAEGMEKGIILTARNLKQAGISKEIIAQTIGLSTEEIDQL